MIFTDEDARIDAVMSKHNFELDNDLIISITQVVGESKIEIKEIIMETFLYTIKVLSHLIVDVEAKTHKIHEISFSISYDERSLVHIGSITCYIWEIVKY